MKVKIKSSSFIVTNMSSEEIIKHEMAALALLSKKLAFWLHRRPNTTVDMMETR